MGIFKELLISSNLNINGNRDVDITDKMLEEAKASLAKSLNLLGKLKKDAYVKYINNYLKHIKYVKNMRYGKVDKLYDYSKQLKLINQLARCFEENVDEERFIECGSLAAIGSFGITSISNMISNEQSLSETFGKLPISTLAFICSRVNANHLASRGFSLGGGLQLSGIDAAQYGLSIPTLIDQMTNNCAILNNMNEYVTNWTLTLSTLYEEYMEVETNMCFIINKYRYRGFKGLLAKLGIATKIDYRRFTKEEREILTRAKELSNVIFDALSLDLLDSAGNTSMDNYIKLKNSVDKTIKSK